MGFMDLFFNKKRTSGDTAKDRLKLLLVSKFCNIVEFIIMFSPHIYRHYTTINPTIQRAHSYDSRGFLL